MKKVVSVLGLTFLLVSTLGCQNVPKKDVVYISPPENLLEQREAPEYIGATYADVLDYVEVLWSWGDKCNADKGSVSEYIQEVKK